MDKFEEYKLLNERAQKLSERRQTTTQTYLTINTAIFGAVSIPDQGFRPAGMGVGLDRLTFVLCWHHCLLHLAGDRQ